MAEKKKAGPSLETTESLYEKAVEKLESEPFIVSDSYRIDNYNLAADMFEQVGDYEDAPGLAKHCREMAVVSAREAERKKYDDAVRRMNSAVTLDQQEKVCEQFRELGDYKDSAELLAKTSRIVEKGRKKGAVKRFVILAVIAAAVIFLAVSWTTGLARYMMAMVYLKTGSYTNARAAFERLGDFLDSEELALEAKHESLIHAKEGSVVPFGSYKWKVLEKDGSVMTMIAASIGKSSDFYSVIFSADKAGWADSELRSWLNGEIYEEGFSDEEKAMMLLQQVPETVNEEFGTKAAGCEDYLTVLSAEECPRWQEALDTLSMDYYLRTPGEDETKEVFISGGSHKPMLFGCPKDTALAVRPVIRIDISGLEGEE